MKMWERQLRSVEKECVVKQSFKNRGYNEKLFRSSVGTLYGNVWSTKQTTQIKSLVSSQSKFQIHDKNEEKVVFKCLSDICVDSFIMYEVMKMKMSLGHKALCNAALSETRSRLYEYDCVHVNTHVCTCHNTDINLYLGEERAVITYKTIQYKGKYKWKPWVNVAM